MRRVVLLAWLVFSLGVSAAEASPRVALVIGNDRYAILPGLLNAQADAKGMAAKLKELGFDVILRLNASRRDTSRALAEFEGRLKTAEVGLVYYAGHGIQTDGVNYLVPTDARIEVEEDLRLEGVEADEFLKAMERAGTPLNIVILDACRDNPLPRRSRSGARGLSVPAIPKGIKGTAIVYSAAPGQTAQDGPRDGHGVFTGELLKVIDRPGITLEQVFKETAVRVAAVTNGRQDPWINSSVKGDFYFRKGRPGSPAAAAPADKETVFWQSIEDSGDPAMFAEYLKQYPNGTFAGLARLKLKRLGERKSAAATPPSPAVPPRSTPAVGTYPGRAPGTVFRDCAGCPEMVVIPAGAFTMGSADRERQWYLGQGGNTARVDQEHPAHRVTVSRAYAVGKYEVTRGEFAAFVRKTGYDAGASCRVHEGGKAVEKPGATWRAPGFGQTDRDPVVCVGWGAAKAYAAWLSRTTGLPYRLPSEAEWEYMARAGTVGVRFWGDDIRNELGCGYANIGDRSRAAATGLPRRENLFGCDDGTIHTAPVGRYRANAFGVHDTLGNVWEWVEDCWHADYVGAPVDGSAWIAGGDCANRVFRGASWFNSARAVRAATRTSASAATYRSYLTGFRVARDLTP